MKTRLFGIAANYGFGVIIKWLFKHLKQTIRKEQAGSYVVVFLAFQSRTGFAKTQKAVKRLIIN